MSPRCSRTLLIGISLLGILGVTSQAEAAPPKLVVPGKEIAIGFPYAKAKSFSAQSVRRVDHLRMPSDVRIKSVHTRGKLGVASLKRGFSSFSTSPVVADEAAIEKACKKIRAANPDVDLICEPNTLFFASATPNDTRYSQLYGLPKIDAPEAWNTTTGSFSVKVAVIDTGIDYNHLDLASNIAKNTQEIPSNGIDDDNNGYTDDYFGYNFAYNNANPWDDDGHGTHCAGTIGARGNDGRGVVGVNWRVGLVPVKVLDSTGSGYLSDIAAGVDYAVARGVSVISMSLGGSSNSQLLENAIGAAKAQGVLVVVAAGNETTNNDVTPSYPANSAHENVISVAATDSSDSLAYFSNYGAQTVDVAAPGVGIVSTIPGGYDSYSGTSMATPHVAGLAALVKAAKPALTYSQLKSVIFRSVDSVSSLRGKISTGGRINAAKALTLALGGTIEEPPPASVTPTPTNPGADDDEWPYKLSLRVSKTKTVARLRGVMTDPNGDGVSDEYVELVCNGKTRGTRLTSDAGAYAFRLTKSKRRSTRSVRCYAENMYGERSPRRRAW